MLAGKPPARADGVARPDLLTDGTLAAEGAAWDAPAATPFSSESSSVTYDLGQPARIQSAFLQGDNNDDYILSVSDDGHNFRELWIARPVGAPGLRGRSTEGLGARARWLRLSPRGGDHVYSVTELQVWTGGLPALSSQPSEVMAARVRAGFVYLVLAFGVALFATRKGTPALQTGGGVAAAGRRRDLPRAMDGRSHPGCPRGFGGPRLRRRDRAAGVAARLGPPPPRAAAPQDRHRRRATAAVLAFACFYNLGRPQFWHNGKQRPMFVHVGDMRIYQPFTKYFDELRYDGVYLASALAYAEDERGGSIESVGATQIRDLRDFRLRPIGELRADMLEVKRRFSDARWAEFKRESTFFRTSMGPGFITSLDDHGANAPPPWVWLARLWIGHVPATETTLTIAGLIDAALLLAMAWAIAACFGWLPMLIAMTVFGATDLYSFGTNWGGATLRHDWLVLLGFAACALRQQRWRLAGALLGAGTMLRVIPAVALIGVVAPAATWLAGQWFRRRRIGLRALLTEHRAARAGRRGGGPDDAGIFLVTALLYGFSAWREWWVRIRALNADLATNEVSLRMLLAGVDQTAGALLRERRPLFVLAQIAGLLTVALAARKRPLEDAMLLALPLALVLMNTVNYHVHFVFLLVLLGARRGLLAAAAPLLVMCLACYWVDLDTDWARHFETLTALVFAVVGTIYLGVIVSASAADPDPAAAEPAPPPPPAASVGTAGTN